MLNYRQINFTKGSLSRTCQKADLLERIHTPFSSLLVGSNFSTGSPDFKDSRQLSFSSLRPKAERYALQYIKRMRDDEFQSSLRPKAERYWLTDFSAFPRSSLLSSWGSVRSSGSNRSRAPLRSSRLPDWTESRTKARLISILTWMTRSLLRTVDNMATLRSVKTYGAYRLPRQPGFEVANCDLKASALSEVNWNMKSFWKPG